MICFPCLQQTKAAKAPKMSAIEPLAHRADPSGGLWLEQRINSSAEN
jgi:hypothetical protein